MLWNRLHGVVRTFGFDMERRWDEVDEREAQISSTGYDDRANSQFTKLKPGHDCMDQISEGKEHITSGLGPHWAGLRST